MKTVDAGVAKITVRNYDSNVNLVGLFIAALKWGARRPASQAAMENPNKEGRWLSYL